MEEVDTPIAAGAQYKTVDDETVLVKSVWVDEDLNTNVQISHDGDSRSVALEDFAERIGPTDLERCNSDHDAWEWRNY